MKMVMIGAALASLPMTCTPLQPQHSEPLPYRPAIRIPYPQACEPLRTDQVNVDPVALDDGLVIWYLFGTDVVFGYSRSEKSNIYPTQDCIERSP